MARSDEYLIAKDGLIARRSGAWARDKLSFLDEYLPPALQATIRKKQVVYVDLFAGPGMNIDDTGKEFEGAALRALKTHAQANADRGFSHAFLVNLDQPADAALRERTENHCADGHCLVPLTEVNFLNEDANEVVHAIMRRIDVKAYVFVFADIEKPNQLPFDTVRALKLHGHSSVDFCVLFPDDMALRRMLPYAREKLRPNVPALNQFFGTETWLSLWERRKSEAQSPERYRALQELYGNSSEHKDGSTSSRLVTCDVRAKQVCINCCWPRTTTQRNGLPAGPNKSSEAERRAQTCLPN
jgi:three-Cys-motif partner protein